MTAPKHHSVIQGAIFALLIVLPLPVPASTDDIQALEKPVLEAFAAGDYRVMYDSLERMLASRPDHPVSILYCPDLLRLANVFGQERVLRTVDAMIAQIRQSGETKDSRSILLQLALVREDLLYQQGPDKGEKATAEISPIRAWRIAGPVFRYGPGDLFYPFVPEKTVEAAQSSIPLKNIVLKNRKGVLDLKEHIYPERGVAYASTSFSAKGTTRIRIYSDSLYKVFINGTERASNTGEQFRRMRILEISGAEKITLMLKILAGDSWGARVFLTDEKDCFIQPAFEKESFRTSCEVSEIEDYPYYTLQQMAGSDPRTANLYLGNYFSEIGSLTSIEYYDRALALGNDPSVRFFSASAMIRLADGDRNSSLYARGWMAMRQISADYKDYIPAKTSLLEREMSDMDISASCREAESLIASSASNFPAYDSYAGILRELELEAEFNRLIDRFTAAFPDSPVPWLHRALFYSGKDQSKEKGSLEEAMKRKYIPEALSALISACLSGGETMNALALIRKYDRDDVYGNEAISAYIKNKEYKRARIALLKEIVRKQDPSSFETLGRLNFLEHIDPMLYWLKAVSLDQSKFGLSDYMDYLSAKDSAAALSKYLKETDPWDEGNSLTAGTSDGAAVSLLRRERVIRVYHDGSSRALCRDIVRINNEQGAQQWGEYRIPYRAKIFPVRIRVYTGKNEYSEGFKVHSIDGTSYISIGSLKQGTVLEMVYSAEDIFDRERSGMMFDHPLAFVQDYDEPVQNFRLDVICPQDMDFSFMLHPELILGQGSDGENKIYTVSGSGLQARHREYFSGAAENVIPFFAFTSMKNEDDLFFWYKGSLSGTGICDMAVPLNNLQGASAEETARRVHDFVKNEIRLTGNYLYQPEKAGDTLFNKRGTAHDRAVLARALLEKMGITSFVALARSKYLPDPGGYISFGMYSDALLYIPLERDKGLWLDFSGDWIPCGAVRNSLEGAQALLILSKGHEFRTIAGKTADEKRCTVNIGIDQNGNAEIGLRMVLTGSYRTIDRLFTNRLYQEETMYTYFRPFFPAFEITEYSLNNLKDPRSPLEISVTGKNNGFALAGKEKIIIKPVIIPSGVYRYISSPERKAPLVIEDPVIENDEYRYMLPETCKNVEVNENYTIDSSFGSATILINKKNNSRELSVVKKIIVTAGKIKPQDYHEFLQFCLNIKKIEYLNITLKND